LSGGSKQKHWNSLPPVPVNGREEQSLDTGGDAMNSQGKTETPEPHEWSERQTVHTPVLSEQSARQGATGQNVRYVLGFGLAAIVIVFLVIWLVYFA
jgi:hypothetical protein